MPTLDAIAPLRFGRFLLEPARRLLSIDNQPVQLSSRAFDILVLLAENRHRIVSKDEIFATVWRGVAVEDNNLAVQMSALRRALGEPPGDPKIILTIPGRGYRFIAPIAEPELARPSSAVPQPQPEAPETSASLSHAPTPIIKQSRRALWPALAAALVTLPLLAWLLLPQFRQPAAPRLSIVVLPFRNLSADPQQDYLADAISDDLTTDLSHIPGSVVIARESADVYKGKAVGAETIGRALHVRYLLEGSLMPEGQALHVNAQLIDTSNGAHLWASKFDVTRDTLGRAQTSIVAQIASALRFTLVQVEAARSLHDQPNNPDAVDLFLRAQSILSRGGGMQTLKAAQKLLEESIKLAPDYADALARLSVVLIDKIGNFDDPDEIKDHTEAKSLIDRALALAPQHPLPIIATGLLAWLDQDCRHGIPSLERALALEPNNMIAKDGLARCARDMGDMQQVINQLESIFAIDPADPGNAPREQMVGMAYLLLGQPQTAIIWLEKSGAGVTEVGNHATSLGWQEWRRIFLIAALQQTGSHDRAEIEYRKYKKLWPNRSVWELATYNSRPLSETKGHAVFLKSLQEAGMPYFYIDENSPTVVDESMEQPGSDFDPTPIHPRGIRLIETQELYNRTRSPTPPFILDCGKGASVISGAVWLWSGGWDEEDELLRKSGIDAAVAHNRDIVVMSESPVEWTSFRLVQKLNALGYRNVLWYRGGEEAWARAGYGADDRRPR